MMVPAWEYRVEERRTTADVAWLNALGQEGWEAVQSLPLHDAMGNSLPQVGHIWLFKRMVLDHPFVLSSEQSAPVGETRGALDYQNRLRASEEEDATPEKPARRHQMSEENRQKARERMQAMVAARKAERLPQQPQDRVSGAPVGESVGV